MSEKRYGEAMKRMVLNAINHLGNPLHLYCRLCGIGLSKSAARSLCRVYEKRLYATLGLGASHNPA